VTVNNLVARLEVFAAAALVDMRLEAHGEDDARAPVIVAGWLPPKRSAGEPTPPLVLIRPTKGQDALDGSTIEVLFLVETFSEDQEGWQDASNILQRLRGALTGADPLGPFCLELPLTWELFADQPKPQWGGFITTTWTQPRIDQIGITQ